MKILTRYVLLELIKVFAVSLAGMTLFMILVGVMKEAYSQGLGLKQVALLDPLCRARGIEICGAGNDSVCDVQRLRPAGSGERSRGDQEHGHFADGAFSGPPYRWLCC